MWFTALLFVLLSVVSGLKIPSFAPPSFEPSTIDNDGTHNGRYDVRKTLAWLDPTNEHNINGYFFLIWATTIDGRKYHITLGPSIFSGTKNGIYEIVDLNDPSNITASGATIVDDPGTASTTSLALLTTTQNISSPAGGDNYTDIYLKSNYGGVVVDLHVSPTGKNLYVLGSGAVGLPAPENTTDYGTVPSGYSWYWGNPTMRVDGNITVNGESMQVDYNQSFGYMERQWGVFDLSSGYYAFWLWMSNGLFLHTWIGYPYSANAALKVPAFATLWHPDGTHEALGVDSSSVAFNPWTNNVTGHTYFTDFVYNIAAKNASLKVQQLPKAAEVTGLHGVGQSIIETYGQGEGVWEGKKVTFFGHVEQLACSRAVCG